MALSGTLWGNMSGYEWDLPCNRQALKHHRCVKVIRLYWSHQPMTTLAWQFICSCLGGVNNAIYYNKFNLQRPNSQLRCWPYQLLGGCKPLQHYSVKWCAKTWQGFIACWWPFCHAITSTKCPRALGTLTRPWNVYPSNSEFFNHVPSNHCCSLATIMSYQRMNEKLSNDVCC